MVARVSTFTDTDAFHPIYAMSSDRATEALSALADTGADAIVMLGTGMPTLAPIAAQPRLGDAMVMSCMTCFAWRLYGAAKGTAPTSDGLMAFQEDYGRRARLGARLGPDTLQDLC